MLNSKAQRRYVNWNQQIRTIIKGASRINGHISQAVSLILNLVREITLNSYGLFCLSIPQYSQIFVALFIMTRVNCQVPINSEIIFVKMPIDIPLKKSSAKSGGNSSIAWK